MNAYSHEKISERGRLILEVQLHLVGEIVGIVKGLWLSLLSGCNLSYFPIWSDEVLLKIIIESLINVNALNRMEINSLS